jgi:hypothetical protein
MSGKIRNPLTGRMIKIGGGVYQELVKSGDIIVQDESSENEDDEKRENDDIEEEEEDIQQRDNNDDEDADEDDDIEDEESEKKNNKKPTTKRKTPIKTKPLVMTNVSKKPHIRTPLAMPLPMSQGRKQSKKTPLKFPMPPLPMDTTMMKTSSSQSSSKHYTSHQPHTTSNHLSASIHVDRDRALSHKTDQPLHQVLATLSDATKDLVLAATKQLVVIQSMQEQQQQQQQHQQRQQQQHHLGDNQYHHHQQHQHQQQREYPQTYDHVPVNTSIHHHSISGPFLSSSSTSTTNISSVMSNLLPASSDGDRTLLSSVQEPQSESKQHGSAPYDLSKGSSHLKPSKMAPPPPPPQPQPPLDLSAISAKQNKNSSKNNMYPFSSTSDPLTTTLYRQEQLLRASSSSPSSSPYPLPHDSPLLLPSSSSLSRYNTNPAAATTSSATLNSTPNYDENETRSGMNSPRYSRKKPVIQIQQKRKPVKQAQSIGGDVNVDENAKTPVLANLDS